MSAVGKVVAVGGFASVAMMFLIATAPCACTTKEMAYRAATRSDLRNLVTAEEDFYADSSRFSSDLGALPFTASIGVRVEVTLADSGWFAQAWHERVPRGRCAVAWGAATNPVRDTLEALPVCEGFEGRQRGLLRRMLRF